MPDPPFTMQWGNGQHLTRALFNQGKVWVTAKSEILQVAEMTPQHCFNTLLMLERMDDLPVENLQSTPLYAALYDRVLSVMPPNTIKASSITAGRIYGGSMDLWPHTPRSVPVRLVGVEPDSILLIIEAALHAKGRVAITYVDSKGVRTYRTVEPYKIDQRPAGFGFQEKYLIARDIDKDELRTFKLTNIERCENA